MNRSLSTSRLLIATATIALGMTACAAALTKPEGADLAREKLTRLQADPKLASRAPVAIKDAETAVVAAEVPRKADEEARHLVIMADRKVDIAVARAQSRLAEDERDALSKQREGARLEARTREADSARDDAATARSQADIARSEAIAARVDTAAALSEAAALQAQMAALNAKETDRGMVVTLGDVLFATGQSDLKGGAASNLGKLSAFLNTYTDRTVLIEGHTDSVGAAVFNLALSQRRADAVKSFLMAQGVDANRLMAAGMGEGVPVASNDNATGRQQNRRVEVIISNTVASAQ
ncbi:OmpA family protein [Flagellatimonas centrodinii]|uniref:OmpA family protein n=1 Tax=Flagellatimonas centrodinii TaxID=2806210 RepID=UPI001FED4778|nr:OmpA family protein [Flagellatimonas centrodinii]ULQ48013.1 OmpA family protein [Flagellatimonas centrodinii]